MANEIMELINETVDHIQERVDFQPEYGIILGTGLGNLVNEIDIVQSLDYTDIPNFPPPTVESHSGRLIFGTIGDRKVVAMQGRYHYYEGYSMQQVTFPVRILKQLGISRLFISNAAGGLNENMQTGDLMIISDHINLQPENPLTGPNLDELGPRFPDMSAPYDPSFVEKGLAIAATQGIRCTAGTYVSVPGPNLETKAEYVYLHNIGADAVGMSTIPEVIVAVHMSLPVFAVSVITDIGYPPEKVEPVSVEKIIAIAGEAEPKMTMLLAELITA
jgi:purine-nucleoside phosphorylase